MNFLKKMNISTVVLVGVLMALLGYQVAANRPVAASGPVATFDLERLFNALLEKQAAFEELPRIARDLEARGEEQRKQLEHVRGSAKYKELEDRLEAATHNYRAYVEFSRVKLESERGRRLKNTYLSIRRGVREFANANGYALVLVDDSVAEIPPGTLEDLNRQISARRVMYSGVDITDALTAYMNDAYVAAGGTQPANPPAAAARPDGR
jgi:Skp family chaperone for outer membrane proteins